jgi:hypothetical protein
MKKSKTGIATREELSKEFGLKTTELGQSHTDSKLKSGYKKMNREQKQRITCLQKEYKTAF